MTDKLLPCPFCGSDEASTYIGDPGPGVVRCFASDCGAIMDGYSTDQEAIHAWNRRPPLSPKPPAQTPSPVSSLSGVAAASPLSLPSSAVFKIWQSVEWLSSGTNKIGTIIAIVPVGRTPAGLGYPKAGGDGRARDHLTYIVEARKVGTKGVYGPKALYWPRVSWLSATATEGE